MIERHLHRAYAVKRERIGPLARTLYLLATFQFVCCYLRHVPSYMRLMAYEHGSDRMPFQGRLLMMYPLRWAHQSSLFITVAAATDKFFPWFLPHATPESVLQLIVDTICIVITGAIAIRIYQAASKEQLLTQWIYPLVLVMCVSTYMLHSTQSLRYYYDFPSLLFFSAGLFLIYFRGHPLLFAAVFLLGTVNRETTLVLLLFFVLAHVIRYGRTDWSRLREVQMWAVVVPLAFVWVAWHLWVVWTFRHNASEVVVALFRQSRSVADSAGMAANPGRGRLHAARHLPLPPSNLRTLPCASGYGAFRPGSP